MSVVDFARSNAREIAAVVDMIDEEALDSLVQRVIRANRVYLTGAGRSGLSARAIAMRLMHIGLSAYAVGEVATPAIAAGDLLIAVTATARGSIASQAQAAHEVGASIAVFTTRAESGLLDVAETVVVLPIRTVIDTQQHAGSLFEQSTLVVGDAVCRAVQERLGVASAELDRRHANLS
ncbi:MAG: SIS domain-containing protein [Microbacterium sp.]|uniref:6-phospho-3-hexuloisomerase n=1 Tax=Microbacterium sp. TaxID=51671 RepID=UPI0039E615CD